MFINNCEITESSIPGKVFVSGTCIISKEDYAFLALKSEIEAYKNGELAQNAFKTLPFDQREFLISGISPEGWRILEGSGYECEELTEEDYWDRYGEDLYDDELAKWDEEEWMLDERIRSHRFYSGEYEVPEDF